MGRKSAAYHAFTVPGSSSGAANVEVINGKGMKLLLKYSRV